MNPTRTAPEERTSERAPLTAAELPATVVVPRPEPGPAPQGWLLSVGVWRWELTEDRRTARATVWDGDITIHAPEALYRDANEAVVELLTWRAQGGR